MPVRSVYCPPSQQGGAVRGCCRSHAGAGRFSPSSRSRPERAGRRWTSSLGVPSEAGPRARSWRGRCGCCRSHAGAGRFSPSSRSRPERAGRRWTSSSRCSFRGGHEGPKLAGAVRVLLVSRRERGGSAPVPGRDRSELGGGGLRHCDVPSEAGPRARSWRGRCGCCWSHAGSGEVQPQFQVATGASWAAVDFVIAVFLPRRARGPEAGGGGAGAAGVTQERGGSAPVPGRDRSELGGGGLRHRGVPSEAGPRARSWRGRCGCCRVTQERGGSAPVPGRDRSELARRGGPLLGGVLGEHRLDGLDDRLHGAFPFTQVFDAQGAGHWPGAAVVAGTSVDSHRLRGWSRLQTLRWVSRPRDGETTVLLAQKWDN